MRMCGEGLAEEGKEVVGLDTTGLATTASSGEAKKMRLRLREASLSVWALCARERGLSVRGVVRTSPASARGAKPVGEGAGAGAGAPRGVGVPRGDGRARGESPRGADKERGEAASLGEKPVALAFRGEAAVKLRGEAKRLRGDGPGRPRCHCAWERGERSSGPRRTLASAPGSGRGTGESSGAGEGAHGSWVCRDSCMSEGASSSWEGGCAGS